MAKNLKESIQEAANIVSNGKCAFNNNSYFLDFTQNIFGKMDEHFQEMYENGNGNELFGKACAAISSAMLVYNFFSWINPNTPFIYNDVVYETVLFELKLKTLQPRGGKANFDVVLIGKDIKMGKVHLLFIESKFTEYLKAKKLEIPKSYEDSTNIFDKTDWKDVIQSIKNIANESIKKRADESKGDYHTKYYEGLKQNFCHLVALNRLIAESKSSSSAINEILGFKDIVLTDENIEFINLIFDPNEKLFKKEHDQYNSYKELLEQFIKIKPESINIWLKKIVSYSELFIAMKDQTPQAHKDYLKHRYIDFSGYID